MGKFFCLGAGWYSRLERVFGRRTTSENYLSERGTNNSYILRSIAISPQPDCLGDEN